MNIFFRVTSKTLQKNRSRTLVTIIGIILSAAMITAVATLVVSFRQMMVDMVVSETGNWYVRGDFVSEKDVSTFRQDQQLESVYLAERLGYGKVGSGNTYKPYLYVIGVQENFLKNMGIHLTEGRLPEREGEIILPEHLMSNGEVKYSPNDTLRIDLGRRMAHGSELGQDNDFMFDYDNPDIQFETLEDLRPYNFKVVGIYARPGFEDYSAPGFTAITYAEETGAAETYEVFIRTKSARQVYDWAEANLDQYETNSDLLLYMGVSRHASFYRVLYGFSAILIALILFGSVSLIYNAFSISVSERTRQFGLLSSIGATRKQIRQSVIYEALIVGCIGVPLGILAGLLGIGITIRIIGAKLGNLFLGARAEGSQLRMIVSWGAMAFSLILGMVTVLISAWIPAGRAMRISAVEAIRGNRDIRINSKKIRENPLIYRLFGLPGLLADKYYKRDKRKYRATIVSLFMSVVLFISASAFLKYAFGSVTEIMQTSEYDLSMTIYTDEEGHMFDHASAKQMEEITDVEEVKRYYQHMVTIAGLQDFYTAEAKKTFTYTNDSGEEEVVPINAKLVFLDDEYYRQYALDCGLNADGFMDPSAPKTIINCTFRFFDEVADRYNYVSILEKLPENLTMTWDDGEGNTHEIAAIPGAITDKHPWSDDRLKLTMMCVFLPASAQDSMVDNLQAFNTEGAVELAIIAPNHKKAVEEIKSYFNESHPGMAYNLYDVREEEETVRNLIFVVKLLSGGFIVLISLIAVANVFNTISTNLMLRRKSIAMLRSVGMTQKGLIRMMMYECLFYGVRALLYGLPVSGVITYLIWKVASNGADTAFTLPWNAILIAVLSVFLVVFISMLYAMNRIRKENLIDALKTEIQ
ncbi:MAG: ABC transporter permease [Firmicutes bacterium]|nr:ABC transporter permease [Bacillota bacterium]